jgi:hypothetical protein
MSTIGIVPLLRRAGRDGQARQRSGGRRPVERALAARVRDPHAVQDTLSCLVALGPALDMVGLGPRRGRPGPESEETAGRGRPRGAPATTAPRTPQPRGRRAGAVTADTRETTDASICVHSRPGSPPQRRSPRDLRWARRRARTAPCAGRARRRPPPLGTTTARRSSQRASVRSTAAGGTARRPGPRIRRGYGLLVASPGSARQGRRGCLGAAETTEHQPAGTGRDVARSFAIS